MTAAALARPEARAAGPGRLLAGAAVAIAIAAAGALLADPGEWLLRWPGWSAAALAASAAGLLADPLRHVSAASPSALALRRALRVAAGTLILAPAWAVVAAAAEPPFAAERVALTVQAAALVLLTLAVEAVLVRRGFEERARLAAMSVPVALIALAALLPGLGLLAVPGAPDWDAAQLRWAGLAAFGAVALAWASRRD